MTHLPFNTRQDTSPVGPELCWASSRHPYEMEKTQSRHSKQPVCLVLPVRGNEKPLAHERQFFHYEAWGNRLHPLPSLRLRISLCYQKLSKLLLIFSHTVQAQSRRDYKQVPTIHGDRINTNHACPWRGTSAVQHSAQKTSGTNKAIRWSPKPVN